MNTSPQHITVFSCKECPNDFYVQTSSITTYPTSLCAPCNNRRYYFPKNSIGNFVNANSVCIPAIIPNLIPSISTNTPNVPNIPTKPINYFSNFSNLNNFSSSSSYISPIVPSLNSVESKENYDRFPSNQQNNSGFQSIVNATAVELAPAQVAIMPMNVPELISFKPQDSKPVKPIAPAFNQNYQNTTFSSNNKRPRGRPRKMLINSSRPLNPLTSSSSSSSSSSYFPFLNKKIGQNQIPSTAISSCNFSPIPSPIRFSSSVCDSTCDLSDNTIVGVVGDSNVDSDNGLDIVSVVNSNNDSIVDEKKNSQDLTITSADLISSNSNVCANIASSISIDLPSIISDEIPSLICSGISSEVSSDTCSINSFNSSSSSSSSSNNRNILLLKSAFTKKRKLNQEELEEEMKKKVTQRYESSFIIMPLGHNVVGGQFYVGLKCIKCSNITCNNAKEIIDSITLYQCEKCKFSSSSSYFESNEINQTSLHAKDKENEKDKEEEEKCNKDNKEEENEYEYEQNQMDSDSIKDCNELNEKEEKLSEMITMSESLSERIKKLKEQLAGHYIVNSHCKGEKSNDDDDRVVSITCLKRKCNTMGHFNRKLLFLERFPEYMICSCNPIIQKIIKIYQGEYKYEKIGAVQGKNTEKEPLFQLIWMICVTCKKMEQYKADKTGWLHPKELECECWDNIEEKKWTKKRKIAEQKKIKMNTVEVIENIKTVNITEFKESTEYLSSSPSDSISSSIQFINSGMSLNSSSSSSSYSLNSAIPQEKELKKTASSTNIENYTDLLEYFSSLSVPGEEKKEAFRLLKESRNQVKKSDQEIGKL